MTNFERQERRLQQRFKLLKAIYARPDMLEHRYAVKIACEGLNADAVALRRAQQAKNC